MDVLYLLLLLLFAARVGGELAERLKYPAVLGEIAGGLAIGPSFFGVLQGSNGTTEFLQLGGILLLFLIGLSTRMEDLNGNVFDSVAIAAMGGLAAFGAIFATSHYILGYDMKIAMFIAAVFTATSTGVCVRALVDMNGLHTKVGRMLISINFVDEFVGIVIFSVAAAFFANQAVSAAGLWKLILVIIGFITVMTTVGSKVVPKIFNMAERMKVEESLLSFALIICFAVALLAKEIGVAVITGAFLAGIMINKSPFTDPAVIPKLNALAYGFFVPMFFANIGVLTNVSNWADWKSFVILFLVVVGSKMLGVLGTARKLGYGPGEAFTLGAGMVPRAEFALLLTAIGYSQGIIDAQVFSTIVVVAIATIFVTPLLMRIGMRKNNIEMKAASRGGPRALL